MLISSMATLTELVEYCDQRLRIREIVDFPGAHNGLQVTNTGEVTKIGAAVDAGLMPFQQAIEQGVDFLIVHHGLFWKPPIPVTGTTYAKLRAAFDGNLAVYGAHLPLDCHPELGNNALLAKMLGLKVTGWFLPYEGTDIAAKASPPSSRTSMREKLEGLFPSVTAIEYGPDEPAAVGILTGSGQSAVSHLRRNGIDTLITGELKQEHFNVAQEEGLNLYCCGHYATETLGVTELAKELSAEFDLPWEFIATDCPL